MTTHRGHKRYGWRPDLPDSRDHLYISARAKLPALVDLRPKMPPIFDQGQTNSCTGNSVGGAIEFADSASPGFVPSRLFLYYNGRLIEGGEDQDQGASIRDVVKGSITYGFPHEDAWPFSVASVVTRPPDAVYDLARMGVVSSYARLSQNYQALRSALADGLPIVCGIGVYESLESEAVAKTGDVPMPGLSERLLGGHAILLVGYDTLRKVYFWRNSWGTTWGAAGYGTLPEAYVHSPRLASDFWVIKTAA